MVVLSGILDSERDLDSGVEARHSLLLEVAPGLEEQPVLTDLQRLGGKTRGPTVAIGATVAGNRIGWSGNVTLKCCSRVARQGGDRLRHGHRGGPVARRVECRRQDSRRPARRDGNHHGIKRVIFIPHFPDDHVI